MSGVTRPPKEEAPSRVFVRVLLLVVLVLAAGIAIWTAVTRQRIGLTENITIDQLSLDTVRTVNGMQINVVQEGLGSNPVVLLHDIDAAGGVLWDDVIDALGPDATVVRIDLPGFGFSQRIRSEDSRYTVASMAETVSAAIEPRFRNPVLFAGVGLGGEVAAEVAVTNPNLVRGLAMIDVDFYQSPGWLEFVERLPWIGPAATYALETGGSFAFDRWAPNCETGGWCPSNSQVESRNLAVSIMGSTDSIRAFRNTTASSLVPSRLSNMTAPAIFIWSDEGDVPRDSVDRAIASHPETRLEVVNAWKAHLDQPQQVADLIWSLTQETD